VAVAPVAVAPVAAAPVVVETPGEGTPLAAAKRRCAEPSAV